MKILKKIKKEDITKEILNLKKKKKTAEDDIKHFVNKADELALKAESSKCIRLVAESNALRTKSKEKSCSILDIDKKLQKLNEDLKIL